MRKTDEYLPPGSQPAILVAGGYARIAMCMPAYGESGANAASGVDGMATGGTGASDVWCTSGVPGTDGPGEAHMGRT